MFQNLKKEEAFIVAVSFWITVIATRTFLFASSVLRSHNPKIMIESFHIHHDLIGIVFLMLAFISSSIFGKQKKILQLAALGVGAGFLIDEFSSLFYLLPILRNDYWSIENFFAIVLFGIFLIIAMRFARNESFTQETTAQHVRHKNPEHPFVSVVIPAFNEEKFLAKTLKSFSSQEFKDFELIMVDNNSTDKTSEIAEDFGAKVVHESRQGVGRARQRGFEEAAGKIIATTDADTIVPPNWLLRISQEFNNNEELVAFGGLYNLYSGTMVVRFIVQHIFPLFSIVGRRISGCWSLPGVNLAVRKEAFLKIGGFNSDISLGEDMDLSLRMKKVGKVVLDLRFRVQTSGRRFSRSFFKGAASYVFSGLWRIVFGKQKNALLAPVRSETFPQGFAFFPILLIVIFLFSLFYNANPQISHAKEVKPIAKYIRLAGAEIKKHGEHLFNFRRRP